MPSAKDFRRIVLGLEGAVESAHMGHPDFRVGGRIFVTLQHDPAWAGLMLTPDQQRELLDAHPKAFKPAAGAWGLAGSTLVHLPAVTEEVLGEAATMCWKNAIAKNARRRTKGAITSTKATKTNTKRKR